MEINDILVHKSEGLVILSEITKMDNIDVKYLVFYPYFKTRIANKIMLPENATEGRVRKPILKEEAEKVIDYIKNLHLAEWKENNKERKQEFDAILANGNPFELSKAIFLIKRKEIEFKGSKKTISKNDGDTLFRAKKLLFSELAYVLDISFEQIEKYYEEAI